MEIEHVFVLMLENRSFDHMLGLSDLSGTDADTGERTSIHGINPAKPPVNRFNGVDYPFGGSAPFAMPVDPGHEFDDVVQELGGKDAKYPKGGPYPPIDNSGFVANYVQRHGGGDRPSTPSQIMQGFAPTVLPVLTTLAKTFVVCDHWWSSMPGPTWPNRFFVHAASSGGLDHSPSTKDIIEAFTVDGYSFEHGTIFDRLSHHDVHWRIYRGDHFPVSLAMAGIHSSKCKPYGNFAHNVSNSDYRPSYTFIEPDYGKFWSTYTCGTSQHPMDDVTRGEWLIKCTYEAIRNSPNWERSLLVVTYDEHGGFFDHKAPPKAVPPGDKTTSRSNNKFGFTFDRYGVRVPAVIVSPYIEPNLVDHRTYDHTSVLATLEDLFGVNPLTKRDKAARSLTDLPRLGKPNPKAPKTLPDPVKSHVKGCEKLEPCPKVKERRPAAESLIDDPVPPGPIDGNIPGFLHVALRRDLEVTPTPKHEERVARFSRIRTREEARDYVREVLAKIIG